MDKKLFFGIVLFFLAGFIFAENRTGKVVHTETASSMGVVIKWVYLDTNDDKIIDTIIYLEGNFPDRDLKPSTLFIAYIKVGSSIVFNYDRGMVRHGIFYDDTGNGDSIVSIDGIAKNRIFTP